MKSDSPRVHMPEAEILQHLEHRRSGQVYWSVIMLLVAAGLMIGIRFLLAGAQGLMLFGPAVFCILFLLLIALKLGLAADKAAIIVMVVLLLSFTVQGYLTSGLHSHFMVMAPFIPLLAILLHGLEAGRVFALLTGLVILFFAVLQFNGHEFPKRPISPQADTIVRAAGIGIFVAACTFVTAYFFKLSDAMGATIWKHANHDHLTDLANRRVIDSAMLREAKIAQRNGTPLSVLMIDIDKFKLFNDVNGHVQGDQCLKQVASTIASFVRRPADTLGRFGGEEFIAILPDTPVVGAQWVAEQVRAAVEDLAIAYDPRESDSLTISVGVACHQGQELDELRLIEAADAALFASKDAGRNCVTVAISNDVTINLVQQG